MIENPAWIAGLLPAFTWAGCALCYYAFSGGGDEEHQRPLRGDAENEPWGRPYNITGKRYRFPGDSIRRPWTMMDDATREFDLVNDERKQDGKVPKR